MIQKAQFSLPRPSTKTLKEICRTGRNKITKKRQFMSMENVVLSPVKESLNRLERLLTVVAVEKESNLKKRCWSTSFMQSMLFMSKDSAVIWRTANILAVTIVFTFWDRDAKYFRWQCTVVHPLNPKVLQCRRLPLISSYVFVVYVWWLRCVQRLKEVRESSGLVNKQRLSAQESLSVISF